MYRLIIVLYYFAQGHVPAVYLQLGPHLQSGPLHPPGSEQGHALLQGHVPAVHLQYGPHMQTAPLQPPGSEQGQALQQGHVPALHLP